MLQSCQHWLKKLCSAAIHSLSASEGLSAGRHEEMAWRVAVNHVFLMHFCTVTIHEPLSTPWSPPALLSKKKKNARILLNNLISFCCWCPQRLVLSSGGHCQLFFSMEKKLRLSPSLLKSKSKDCKESCDAPRLTAVGNVFLPGGLNQEPLLAFWFVVSFHSLFYPSCHFQSRGWFFMHRP